MLTKPLFEDRSTKQLIYLGSHGIRWDYWYDKITGNLLVFWGIDYRDKSVFTKEDLDKLNRKSVTHCNELFVDDWMSWLRHEVNKLRNDRCPCRC